MRYWYRSSASGAHAFTWLVIFNCECLATETDSYNISPLPTAGTREIAVCQNLRHARFFGHKANSESAACMHFFHFSRQLHCPG